MKILITGTHFTTALAVIEELKKYKDVELVYVGRGTTLEGDSAKSVESEELPRNGVKFIPITAGRLQRSFTIYTVPSLLKIPIGFIEALGIIFREKPEVILSFGGYVSVPIVVIAWLFSIPIIIHEQTLITGLANKISAWFADKVAISFSESGLKRDKVILTGNPLRGEIYQGVYLPHLQGVQRMPTILITGGNQGSHAINLTVEGCLDKLLKVANIIHQTGDSKYKDFERLESKQIDNYQVMKWIPNMAEIMVRADLVISRAGINTLSELAYLEKPALVIPYPYLYQDEQNKNAKYFERLGMVRLLAQSKLNSNSLLEEIRKMLKNLKKYQAGAKKAKLVLIPDAAKRVALETMLLTKVK